MQNLLATIKSNFGDVKFTYLFGLVFLMCALVFIVARLTMQENLEKSEKLYDANKSQQSYLRGIEKNLSKAQDELARNQAIVIANTKDIQQRECDVEAKARNLAQEALRLKAKEESLKIQENALDRLHKELTEKEKELCAREQKLDGKKAEVTTKQPKETKKERTNG